MLKAISTITNALGALNYKGTWNASTNSPALASGVGTKGDYYVVSVAGATTLDGISNWGVGDLATFNGSVWQRVEGGADLNGVNLSVSNTSTLSGLTASTALALNASKEVVSVANTGTGNNVLADSPTLVTPALGTPASGVVTNLTGTASININGTVGATTPASGSFTTINGGAAYQASGFENATYTISTAALVYSLNKDTGAAGGSSTTTFNITGVPNTDGSFALIYVRASNTAPGFNSGAVVQVHGTQLFSSAVQNTTKTACFVAFRQNGTWVAGAAATGESITAFP